MRLTPRRVLCAAIAVPPLALLVAWLGIVNVGAASGHWAITEWFLQVAMRGSVCTYALFVDPPEALPDDALRPAAGHFDRGCAICHGAPGEPRSPTVRAMLPEPPDLTHAVGQWTDAELFRIVKRGLRYTGMPAWPNQVRDDEVWMTVAFLRALEGLAPGEYARLTEAPEGAAAVLPPNCARCHGPEGREGGPHVPILAGQHAAYLRDALEAYAADRRPSGFMALPATGLPEEARARLAEELAALAPPPPEPVDSALAAAGRRLAEHGRPQDEVPPCSECHGPPPKKPAFPRLDGQRHDYLVAQLELFRAGVRGGGPYAHLMARAARQLTDADIAAAAAYFASRERGPARPEPEG